MILIFIGIATIQVILLSFIPESPRWLIKKHKIKEATKALQLLNKGYVSDKSIANEIDRLSLSYKTDINLSIKQKMHIL